MLPYPLKSQEGRSVACLDVAHYFFRRLPHCKRWRAEGLNRRWRHADTVAVGMCMHVAVALGMYMVSAVLAVDFLTPMGGRQTATDSFVRDNFIRSTQPSLYILHGVYYVEDRESRPYVWYRACSL